MPNRMTQAQHKPGLFHARQMQKAQREGWALGGLLIRRRLATPCSSKFAKIRGMLPCDPIHDFLTEQRRAIPCQLSFKRGHLRMILDLIGTLHWSVLVAKLTPQPTQIQHQLVVVGLFMRIRHQNPNNTEPMIFEEPSGINERDIILWLSLATFALPLLLALGKVPRRNTQVNVLDTARYCWGRAIFRIKSEVVWQVIAHRLLITTEIH